MDKMAWIKDLVRTEQQMEESGMVEMSTGFKPEKLLLDETTLFLIRMKREFVEATNGFNQLKGSPVGRIKIYSVSQTQADFMIFRNGFKLVFAMKQPGVIAMRFNRAQSLNPAIAEKSGDEETLMAQWGPFGDLVWTYNDQPIKLDYLVKYYTTRFVHESAK